MTVVTKLDNPYWDEVQTFPSDDLRWNKNRFEPDSYPDVSRAVRTGSFADFNERRTRSTLVKQYAFSIPSNTTIRWLADQLAGREVVEIGAGTGYWAYLLEQLGIPVTCYDEALIAQGEKNHWFEGNTTVYHKILRGEERTVAKHSDKVLLLSWPPYESDMGINTLRAYAGDTVVYIGEGAGGCCASDEFFDELGLHWDEVAEHMPIQWSGIHDWISIYRRAAPHIIQEEP